MRFLKQLFNSCRNLCSDDVKRVGEGLAEFFAALSHDQLETINAFFNAMATDERQMSDKSPQVVQSEMARTFDFLTGVDSNPAIRNTLSGVIARHLTLEKKNSTPKELIPRANIDYTDHILLEIVKIQPLFLNLLLPGLNEGEKKKVEKLKLLMNALDSQIELQSPSSAVMHERMLNAHEKRENWQPKIPDTAPVLVSSRENDSLKSDSRGPAVGPHHVLRRSKFGRAYQMEENKRQGVALSRQL